MAGAAGAGPPLTIGVNVAARQMNDPGFAELVRRVLAETGMAAKRLRLEVTETSLATTPDKFWPHCER